MRSASGVYPWQHTLFVLHSITYTKYAILTALSVQLGALHVFTQSWNGSPRFFLENLKFWPTPCYTAPQPPAPEGPLTMFWFYESTWHTLGEPRCPFPIVAGLFYNLTHSKGGSVPDSPGPHPHLLISGAPIAAILMGVSWYLTMALIYYFFEDYWCWASFDTVLAIFVWKIHLNPLSIFFFNREI